MKLELSRKTYEKLPDNDELREKVKEMEEILSQPRTIWDNYETEMWDKVNKLSLSDRRLLIVYSIVGTVNKVAKLYSVDRTTISNRLSEIKSNLGVIL